MINKFILPWSMVIFHEDRDLTEINKEKGQRQLREQMSAPHTFDLTLEQLHGSWSPQHTYDVYGYAAYRYPLLTPPPQTDIPNVNAHTAISCVTWIQNERLDLSWMPASADMLTETGSWISK